MFERTEDPYLIIVGKEENFIIYYNWVTDEQWVIWGKCNYCGECIEGAVNLPCESDRMDIPVRPEISQKMQTCVLRGAYL